MSVYTYALLVPPVSPLILPAGMKGNVELICCCGLGAIVEQEICVEQIQTTDQQLLQAVLTHDRVIGELFPQTSLVPLRFGSGFSCIENLLAHLEQHQQQYLQALAQLANKVEYTLTFTPCCLSPVLVSDVRGKDYLLAKKQRYQIQQEFQTQQYKQWEQLSQLIFETYTNAIWETRQGNVRQIHLLVERNDTTLSKQQLFVWQEQCSHWQLTLRGPLAPYYFANTILNSQKLIKNSF
jgi:hypothetical protein